MRTFLVGWFGGEEGGWGWGWEGLGVLGDGIVVWRVWMGDGHEHEICLIYAICHISLSPHPAPPPIPIIPHSLPPPTPPPNPPLLSTPPPPPSHSHFFPPPTPPHPPPKIHCRAHHAARERKSQLGRRGCMGDGKCERWEMGDARV